MLNPTTGPLRPRVLIVDDALAQARNSDRPGRRKPRRAPRRAQRRRRPGALVRRRRGDRRLDASLRAVLLNWHLGTREQASHAGDGAAPQAARAPRGRAGVPACRPRARQRHA